MSREQVWGLLQAARGDALEAFWVLAVTTGMRNGELLALQWRDVDLDARTLRVRRSVFNGAVSSPKTAAGNRTIRLTGMAEAALKEHRLATAKRQISEWVFSSRAGTPLSVHNVYRRVEALAAEGGASADDEDARLAAHLRHAAPVAGRPGQGGQRDAGPRPREHHAGHLLPRPTRHAGERCAGDGGGPRGAGLLAVVIAVDVVIGLPHRTVAPMPPRDLRKLPNQTCWRGWDIDDRHAVLT